MKTCYRWHSDRPTASTACTGTRVVWDNFANAPSLKITVGRQSVVGQKRNMCDFSKLYAENVWTTGAWRHKRTVINSFFLLRPVRNYCRNNCSTIWRRRMGCLQYDFTLIFYLIVYFHGKNFHFYAGPNADHTRNYRLKMLGNITITQSHPVRNTRV